MEAFHFYCFPSIFKLKLMFLLFVFSFLIDTLAVNLGGLLLQALLEYWPRTHVNPIDEEENEVNHGSYFYIRIIGFKITLKLRIFRCYPENLKKNFFKHLLKYDIINGWGMLNLLPSLLHAKERPSSLN